MNWRRFGYTTRDLRHGVSAFLIGGLLACLTVIVLVHIVWGVPT